MKKILLILTALFISLNLYAATTYPGVLYNSTSKYIVQSNLNYVVSNLTANGVIVIKEPAGTNEPVTLYYLTNYVALNLGNFVAAGTNVVAVTNGSLVTISLAEPVNLNTLNVTNFTGAGGSLTNMNINGQTNFGAVVLIEPTGTNQAVTLHYVTNQIAISTNFTQRVNFNEDLDIRSNTTNGGNYRISSRTNLSILYTAASIEPLGTNHRMALDIFPYKTTAPSGSAGDQVTWLDIVDRNIRLSGTSYNLTRVGQNIGESEFSSYGYVSGAWQGNPIKFKIDTITKMQITTNNVIVESNLTVNGSLTIQNVTTNLGNTTFTNITKTADGGTNYSFSANNATYFVDCSDDICITNITDLPANNYAKFVTIFLFGNGAQRKLSFATGLGSTNLTGDLVGTVPYLFTNTAVLAIGCRGSYATNVVFGVTKR